MKYVLVMIFLFVSACGSSNEYLIDGNTQVRVEYYGEMEVSTCHPNLTCKIRNNTECVSILYDEAKESAKKGVQAIKNKNYDQAAFEFSFALCNIMNIDKIFERMEQDNYDEWKKLRRNGTIEHIRLTGVQLSILAEQCEQLHEPPGENR